MSRQIIREYLAVMTRPPPGGHAFTMPQAISASEAFLRIFRVLEDGPPVWAALSQLGRTTSFGGSQVHDANIVATMLAHRETRLLTFNAKHFRRFEPLIEIIEP